MKNSSLYSAFITFILILLATGEVFSQLSLTLEGGAVIPGYNRVRAPNTSMSQGSLFNFNEDFNTQKDVYYLRAEAMVEIKERHQLKLTAVPLSVEYDYTGADPISFEGQVFTPENLTGRYQFNTYRFTYRYLLINRDVLKLGVGATGLLRDAEISLTNKDFNEKNTDLGFVPLLSAYAQIDIFDSVGILIDGDALVGPVGRAEDVFVGALFLFGEEDDLKLRLGYRIIEGGADVGQVYNFALFNLFGAGLTYTF